MKKIFLLILTLAISHGVLVAAEPEFDALVGDYKTVFYADGTPLQWEDNNNWQVCTVAGNPGTWATAGDNPFPTGSESNIYISTTVVFTSNFTLGASSKIWILDNGINDVYLFVGYHDEPDFVFPQNTTIYGEIDIAFGNSASLVIADNSNLYLKSGGKITDHAGNVTNNNTNGGIFINISAENLAGSLITSSPDLNGYYDQKITADRWYLFSSPLSNTTAAAFQNGIYPAYLRPFSPSGGWGAYIFDETTDITEGVGFLLWESSAFTFSEFGTFNNGPMNLLISSGGDDWNLIGNPFPCGLDWTSIDENTNAVGSAFVIYDGTRYISNNGTFTTADTTASPIIPPFQGFFVKWASGTDITVDAINKVHTTNTLYKSQAIDDWTNHIKLTAQFEGQTARTVCYQRDEATNAHDLTYDAPMMFSGSESTLDVYSWVGVQQTSINSYGEYPYVMEVGFKVPIGGGEITLTPADLRNMDPLLAVSLQDTETGAYIDFLANPTYTFNALGGDVTDRIYLIMNNNVGIKDIDKNSIQIFSNKNAVYLGYSDLQFSGEIKIYNLLGQTVYQSKLTNNNYKPIYLNQASAYYIVELITENENLTQKVFIQQ